jgi:hypothetical protein
VDDRLMHYSGGVELPLEPDGIEDVFAGPFGLIGYLFSLDTSQRSGEVAIDDFVTQPQVFSVTPVWSPVLVFDQPTGGNTSANAYYFTVLEGLDHRYPNAWPGMSAEEIDENRGVTMAALHLQFFRDHPRPR